MNEATVADVRRTLDDTALADAWAGGRKLSLEGAAQLGIEAYNQLFGETE
jgi:hypothetical protein